MTEATKDNQSCFKHSRNPGLLSRKDFENIRATAGHRLIEMLRPVLFFLLLLGHSLAFGQSLRFSAPPECPSAERFKTAVLKSTPNLSALKSNRYVLTATITTSSTAFGTLQFKDGAQRYPPREVSGANCQEVFEALVLIASLTLEGLPKGPIRTVIPAKPDPPSWRLTADAQGNVLLGGLATASFGASGSIDFISPSGFSLGLGVVYGAQTRPLNTEGLENGTLSMTLVTGRLSGCPLSIGTESFRFSPCLTFDLGLFSGVGRGVENAATANTLWVAPGVSTRVRLSVAGPLYVELNGGAQVPLRRPRFLLGPAQTIIYRVSVITGFLGAGLGATFL